MPTFKVLLSALFLVLMVWAGGFAHAAEPVECIPATAETAGHYEGDSDQLPLDREQGVAHHHASCNGHQLAANSAQPELLAHYSSATLPRAGNADRLGEHDPDGDLRPPIA